jgi:hypothetical protein
MVGLIGNSIEAIEFKTVLSKQKQIDQNMYDLSEILAR